MLTVKIVSAPAVAAPSQEPAQQSAAVVAAAVPVAQSGSKTAVGNSQSAGAGAVEVRSFNAQNGGSATESQKPAATLGAADTVSTLQRMEMFFLLLTVLSVVIFSAGILSKISARRRAVIITDYSDSTWDGDGFAHPTEVQSLYASPYEEEDLPFIDPQEQQALVNGFEQIGSPSCELVSDASLRTRA
jgi:hypothetical protein